MTTALLLAAAIQPAPFAIGDNLVGSWNGVAAAPVGVVLPADAAQIQAALGAGIREFIIEFPTAGAGGADLLQTLEQAGARYFIAFETPMPGAQGWLIEPDALRIPDVRGVQEIDIPLPGAESALVLTASTRDGSIIREERRPVVDGRLQARLDSQGLSGVGLIYPKVSSPTLPDLWQGFDALRDRTLNRIESLKPGPGCRGIIDPLGTAAAFPDGRLGLVPTDPFFRMEFEQMLRVRHRTIRDLLGAWQIRGADMTDHAAAARLVPLFEGDRGVTRMWDPEANRHYEVASRSSTYWTDLRATVIESMHRRMNRVYQAVQDKTGLPVIQTMIGWNGPYDRSSTTLAGVGVRLSGSNIQDLLDDAAPSVSLVRRWLKPGISIASDIRFSELAPGTLRTLLVESGSMGVSGWYFRLDDADRLPEVKAAADDPLIQRIASRSLSEPIRAPVAARPTASTVRLLSGPWFLPSPEAGARLEWGPGLDGFVYEGVQDRYVAVWSTQGTRRIKLLTPEAETLQFQSFGPDPAARTRRGEIELTVSDQPLLIRRWTTQPVAEEALTVTGARIQKILDSNLPSNDPLKTFTDRYRTALRRSRTEPKATLDELTDVLRNMAAQTAPFTWVEGEALPRQTFGEIVPRSGAGGGRALSLNSRLPGQNIEFSVPVATGELPVTLWIAGSLPKTLQNRLIVETVGENIRPEIVPVSRYGDGLAWHRLGVFPTRQQRPSVQIRFELPVGVTALIDAIVVSRGDFRPDGGRIPLDWIDSLKPVRPGPPEMDSPGR
ncbi:MAG: hypothetical protein MH204_00055 [Fimbriimonadaceae bacterium]|nr:hypothetical protein [Fimbriimonadaceae bacterium]